MHSSEWNDKDREFVDDALRRFEESWKQEGEAEISSFLPNSFDLFQLITPANQWFFLRGKPLEVGLAKLLPGLD